MSGAFDILDWANSVEGRDSAMLRAEVLSGNQLQIEHAMQRAVDGQYGLCEVCEDQIPAERLKVLPEATRCVECQAGTTKQRVREFVPGDLQTDLTPWPSDEMHRVDRLWLVRPMARPSPRSPTIKSN